MALSKQGAPVPPSSPVSRPISFERHLYVQNAVRGNEYVKAQEATTLTYERRQMAWMFVPQVFSTVIGLRRSVGAVVLLRAGRWG